VPIRFWWLPLITFFVFPGCRRQEPYPIRFFREEVKIVIDSFRVTVAGTYHFKNLTNQSKTAKVCYPFPIDEFHFYPDLILTSEFDYTKNDSGITLLKNFKPMAQESLSILYQQKLKDRQVRYILLTTKHWQRPLTEARFVISLPKDFKSPQFSYRPDSLRQQDQRRYYYLTKKNFFPKKDLIITWQ